jgi:hypothetical protein
MDTLARRRGAMSAAAWTRASSACAAPRRLRAHDARARRRRQRRQQPPVERELGDQLPRITAVAELAGLVERELGDQLPAHHLYDFMQNSRRLSKSSS